MIKLIRNLIFLAAAFYLGFLAYGTYYQRDMLYFPNSTYQTPEEAGAHSSLHEMEVTTEDNLKIKGWYAPATTKPATIVFFHGNADHLSNLIHLAGPYIDDGYGFLIAEYRGYSRMTGKPTENGLYADARAYVHGLFDKGVDVDHLIVMGHSLGAAVATQVAREFHPAGLVLLAPFTSAPNMAEERYPYFPVHLLMFDQFANDEKLSVMSTPLMIIHGSDDHVVPLAHGKELFEMAQEPKRLRVLEGHDHGDLFYDSYLYITNFADEYVKK